MRMHGAIIRLKGCDIVSVSNTFFNLFGNNNSNNSIFGSFNFSDYASIRNGSYAKLMRSYYSNAKASGDSASSTAVKTNIQYNTGILDTTNISALRKSADILKDTAKSFSSDSAWTATGSEYDRSSIEASIKDFVKDYNDVIDKDSAVSVSRINNSTGWMKSLTSVMEKALDKAGISVGTDGKLSVDDKALSAADNSSLKSLFYGSSSYAAQIAKKAESITSAAVNSTSLYSGNATYTGMTDSYYNYFV